MIQNSLFNLLDARPFKRYLATEKLICDDTEAPNIAFKVTRLVHDSLRRPISECATILLHGTHVDVLEVACRTKASYFD